MSQTQQAFHLKYRPRSFKTIIGHETVVTRLQGLVNSKKIPNALFFSGPSSAGKTTLARCFAVEINGVESVEALGQDYMELNASDQGNIDDIRNLIKIAKFRPRNKYRVIVIDEAQGLLRNNAAANAFLKPLEEPSANTIWIICSMDPQKFTSGVGRAIANRCTQFVLEPHTNQDLYKQAKRIAKKEGMDYAEDVLKDIVKYANSEMRTLGNLMQGLQQYYEGLEKKPKKLKEEHVSSVLQSTESSDDKLAADVLLAVFTGKFAQVQRCLLDVQDGFQFISKLLWMNQFLLNNTVLDGAKHRKVWWTPANKDLHTRLKKSGMPTLGMMAATNATLVEVKGIAQSFATSPEELLSAKLYRLIKEIHSKEK